ncbi:MAG: hypothetical protein ACXWWC_11620 [Chitinophagaceae bacterium]
MKLNNNYWNRVFLFSAGIFIGTAFCMKWMEADFWIKGEKFTILGLELFYTREKMIRILSGLETNVRTILSYHLYFDFAFMAGVYPGIAALCMMAGRNTALLLSKKLLTVMAGLQIAAWACDIIENCYLLSWMQNPLIGNELELFHLIVGVKWLIALCGIFLSLLSMLIRKKE